MKKLVYIFAVLVLAVSAYPQAWSGILDPSRATDWTQAGIPGGIPNRTTVCQTVSLTAGSGNASANSTAINSALTSCSGTNEVVMIAAGTWYVAGLNFGVGTSNVTLRGAGPTQTILLFTALTSCGNNNDVCIYGSTGGEGNYPTQAAWTGGYAKGASSITIGAVTGTALAVGKQIVLDQRDDTFEICPASGGTGNCASVAGASESGSTVTIQTTLPHGYSNGQKVGIGCVGSGIESCSVTNSGYDGWYTITAVPTSTSFQYTDSTTGLAASGGGQSIVDNGGYTISCVGGPTCSSESGSGYPEIGRSCPDGNVGSGGSTECATGEISYREQTEIKTITSIAGSTIGITPPLINNNWRSSQNPGIWSVGVYAVGDGIENMTLDFSSDGGGSTNGGVSFYNAYECWAKNMRTIDSSRNHYWLQHSQRIEIVDSYLFGTKNGATKSYGIEVYDANSNNLAQNNICQHVVGCILTGGDSGSVYAYNFATDTGYHPPDWLEPLITGNHDTSEYDLFEGNDSNLEDIDDIHGNGMDITFFRNRLNGQESPLKTNALAAAFDDAYNRAANFAGNVLGTHGVETQYINTTLGGYQIGSAGYVWSIGTESDNGGTLPDPITLSTVLRWGNWDNVKGATQWNSAEVPTGAVYGIGGNPIPPHTFPVSFYLSTQPAWWSTPWGTPAWPAIGPDVTSGVAPDAPNAMQDAIPAQICWLMTPVDPAYQSTFAVTGASWSGGTVTLTASNSLAADETITVTGIAPSGYDGTFQVTAATAATVTYALASNPGSFSSGGTISYPNIRLYDAAKCYASYGAGSFSGFGGNTY